MQSLHSGRIVQARLPSPNWGEGPGGEGPRPQTSTELLPGLTTCALSLTLSPGGRGNWLGVGRYVRDNRRMMPFPTELPGNAVVAFRQDYSSPSPLSQLGRGAGGRGRELSECT